MVHNTLRAAVLVLEVRVRDGGVAAADADTVVHAWSGGDACGHVGLLRLAHGVSSRLLVLAGADAIAAGNMLLGGDGCGGVASVLLWWSGGGCGGGVLVVWGGGGLV